MPELFCNVPGYYYSTAGELSGDSGLRSEHPYSLLQPPQEVYAIVISCALYTWRGVVGPSYVPSLKLYICYMYSHRTAHTTKMAGRLDDLL